MSVEAKHKRLIVTGANHMLQKTSGGFLLEIETAMHRSANVDEQSHFQRKIGLPFESKDRLRRLVIVKNMEVALVQIAHKLAMPVRGNKKDVDLVHSFLDSEDRILVVDRDQGAAANVREMRTAGSSYELVVGVLSGRRGGKI